MGIIKVTDHYFYRKKENGGTVKRNKVLKGSGEISYHMRREILRKQLKIIQEEFNRKI